MQVLVHGLQFGLASFINGVDSAADYPNGVVDTSSGGVVARRLVYRAENDASKTIMQMAFYDAYQGDKTGR